MICDIDFAHLNHIMKAGKKLSIGREERIVIEVYYVEDDEIIADLLADEDKLHQMKVNTKLLAKKNSTRDICDIILGKD